MLKVMLESPKRYKAQFIDKTIAWKETAALQFGTAIHLALLEPTVFLTRYRVEPELRRNTTNYKEWKEAVLIDNPHAVIVSQEQMDAINGMVESIMAHKEASAMLRKGIPERSIYQDVRVEDPVTGQVTVIPGKARTDWLHENGDLIDLKTTRDCAFGAFRRQLYELGYHTSAAYHRHLVELELGRRDSRYFWWIALEKEPPYEVAVYRANDMVLDRGESDWRKAVWRLGQCQASGVWPGKQEQAQDIDLPAWAQYE